MLYNINKLLWSLLTMLSKEVCIVSNITTMKLFPAGRRRQDPARPPRSIRCCCRLAVCSLVNRRPTAPISGTVSASVPCCGQFCSFVFTSKAASQRPVRAERQGRTIQNCGLHFTLRGLRRAVPVCHLEKKSQLGKHLQESSLPVF